MPKEKDLGVSDALRKAGFVKIPAWWVLPDELEVIHRRTCLLYTSDAADE